jgi:transcriptional regulator with XRE-family HTH domain
VTKRHNPRSGELAILTSRFGKTVKGYRLGLGYSQEELSWRAEMHRTYLADVERGGRNISLLSIVRLVRALGLTLDEFFRAFETHPSPKPEAAGGEKKTASAGRRRARTGRATRQVAAVRRPSR